LTNTIFGEYLISVKKKNGQLAYPFGKKPNKNLILDTFYQNILNGYSEGLHSFIQTCRVGSSSTAAARTQTGLVGSILGQTHRSTFFNASFDSATNKITLVRDFTFAEVPAGTQVTYAEACVGNFSIGNTSPITTSRFVFPGLLVLEAGDILKVTYSLNLIINYLNSNLAITLTGSGLNFSGYVRMSTNDTGILPSISGNNTIITLGNTNAYVYRDFTVDSSTTTVNSDDPLTYGAFQNIFGTATWLNNAGFFDSAHTPANYPNPKLSYTASGPLANVSFSNLQQTSTFSSIDAIYSFPSHPSSRSVGGIYLWHHSNTASNTAIYYKFNNNQTIPANTPITVKMRWRFNR
jgi:hypothetical protein